VGTIFICEDEGIVAGGSPQPIAIKRVEKGTANRFQSSSRYVL
jgi:hypothetical protein